MPPWIGQGMSAGVRDVANLCWKLAAVLNGQAPDSLLDTYQVERMPHVTEVTRRACLVGRLITGQAWLSGGIAVTLFGSFLLLWFGYPHWHAARAARQKAPR